MNNKGLTVIEMITSFTISSVIIIILLSVVMNIKNIYTTSGLKTEMLIKQSNLSTKMNKIINSDSIVGTDLCVSENYDICYSFSHVNGNDYLLQIDTTENVIEFDGYIYKLDKNSYFGDIEIGIDLVLENQVNTNDSILYIKIPIYNKHLGNDNFGVNLIYPFINSDMQYTI